MLYNVHYMLFTAHCSLHCTLLTVLEDTARYAGLLLAPAEGFGLWPRVFFALRAKKTNYYVLLSNFRKFCFPVVTLVTLKRIQKVQKKIK